MQVKRGFTLVEILIVVVILGILAAIVIPQFTQASTEAKENSLCSDLQSLRSQIQLYRCQHNDNPPTFADFADQMLYCTDIDGATAATPSKVRDPNADIEYGPYLERIPANPFTDSTAIVTLTTEGAPASGSGTNGWQYNETTGEIWSDDDESTADGVLHCTL